MKWKLDRGYLYFRWLDAKSILTLRGNIIRGYYWYYNMSQKDIIWEEMTLGHKIKCESKGRDKWWHFTLFVLSSLLIFSIRLSNNIVIWFPNTTCFRWINDIFPWFPSFYSGMGSYFSHRIIWLGWKSSKERRDMRSDTFPWFGWMAPKKENLEMTGYTFPYFLIFTWKQGKRQKIKG